MVSGLPTSVMTLALLISLASWTICGKMLLKSPWFRSWIHLPSSRASRTHLFFHLECAKTAGKACLSGRPPSHEQAQKEAVAPSPMVTTVAATKRERLLASQGGFVPTHGLLRSVQLSQSQRRRRARANVERSWMPSPLQSVGVVIVFHTTLHLPPLISSSCAQRKHLLALLNSLKNFLGARNTVMAKVGMAESTQRTSTRRPANGSTLPFQPASLALILSKTN
ncbi:hypothetical protein ACQJBY_048627 [Aegilops geniculata]